MGLVSENLLEMLHARGVVKEGAKCTPMLRLGDWLAINALSMEDALAVVEGFFFCALSCFFSKLESQATTIRGCA